MTEARYDIEEKTEYRYRKRDFRYFEPADKYEFAGNYVRTDTEYGVWSLGKPSRFLKSRELKC